MAVQKSKVSSFKKKLKNFNKLKKIKNQIIFKFNNFKKKDKFYFFIK